MGFLIPFLMCAVFLFVWFALCKLFLAIYTFSVKRALLRSPCLDKNSAAALLSVDFGAKSLFRGRWFPERTPNGTMYREIPCILLFGRKLFVLELCPYPGLISNTEEESWHIDPPKEYRRKKEVRVPNPVLLAKERAEILKELFDVLNLPFEVSVESMAILTDKRHSLQNPAGEGLYKLPEAAVFLSDFASKSKPSQKKMKREEERVLAVLERYSLSRARAVARNDRMRRKKK
ncbi:MAG: NERD domain-containing protein [Clostridia bacterium]|nr:NERD domain-containing protein [Clostridia bacterium]